MNENQLVIRRKATQKPHSSGIFRRNSFLKRMVIKIITVVISRNSDFKRAMLGGPTIRARTWLRPAYGLVLLTLAYVFEAHVPGSCTV